MRNIVGQAVRGDDYFPRSDIAEKIYRRIHAGDNIYLSAPRRIGKSSILRDLEDSNSDEVLFIYLIVESVDDPELYYKEILYQLSCNEKFNSIYNLSEKLKKLIRSFKSIKIHDVGFELNHDHDDYFKDFRNLISKFEADGKKIVLMVDEFPQALENIMKKHGPDEARKFLQTNRVIRQNASKNINFILTGSIGLPILAEKLNASKMINDLNIIQVPLLNREEAKRFTLSLLDSENLKISEESLNFMLDEIQWFSPFHIQLLVQEFIDTLSGSISIEIDNKLVSNAIDIVTGVRNNANFEHYFIRLKENFEDNEFNFVTKILKELSLNDSLTIDEIDLCASEYKIENIAHIFRTLEYDGYLFQSKDGNKKIVRFVSPILRLWWRQYVN